MNKIYVGCSLTNATQEFRDQIDVLKEFVSNKYELLSFLGFGAGTPQEIFDHDINCVRNADFMIADCSYPSTGLGIELGYAYSRNIPVLLFAEKDSKVGAIISGLPNKFKDVVRYEKILDVLPEIDSMIKKYAKE